MSIDEETACTPDRLQALRATAAFYSSDAVGYKRLWAPELLTLSRRLLAELPLRGVRRVPNAVVVGVDVAQGMVALSPRGFLVATMDASFLALRSETFGVGILAFVLFHLPDLVGGVEEIGRVLTPGGTVGTITWGEAPDYAALRIWTEELEARGAPPQERVLARHDLVDTPSKSGDSWREPGTTR